LQARYAQNIAQRAILRFCGYQTSQQRNGLSPFALAAQSQGSKA
jgi:hypothetical protein